MIKMVPAGFNVETNPTFHYFANDSVLNCLKLREVDCGGDM